MPKFERKVSQADKQELYTLAISLLHEGYSRSEILKVFRQNQPDVSDFLLDRTYSEAIKILTEEQSIEVVNCVVNHTAIYEELFREFYAYNNIGGQNRAMGCKEKMLGLHKDESKITINNKVKFVKKDSQYDFERLTTSEKDRLNELLNKAKSK